MNFFFAAPVQGIDRQFFLNMIRNITETLQQQRMKGTTFPVQYHTERFFMRKCFFVNTFADQGIVSICQGNSLSGNRNFLSFQSVRISSSVIAFMVSSTDFISHLYQWLVFVQRQIFQHIRSYRRMGFHNFKFFFCQTSRLV